MAKKTASDYEIDVNLLINGAEEIELPKDSIDTVVMTYLVLFQIQWMRSKKLKE